MKKYFCWPLFIVLAALVVAALVPAFSLLHSGSLSKAHASGATSLSLSSATGQPGTVIQASGQGFVPGEQLNLYLNQVNGTLLASAVADSSGNLPATNLTVPSQPTGQYTVVAMQAQSGISANATLTIVPIFSLAKNKVQPGSFLAITGAGFASQEYVNFFLDTTTGMSFEGRNSDASGNISSSINMPFYSVLQGQHTIIAKSDVTGDMASFPVTSCLTSLL